MKNKTNLATIFLGILIVVIIGILLHIGLKGGITGKYPSTEPTTKCNDSLYPNCTLGTPWCQWYHRNDNTQCVASGNGYGYGCECTRPPSKPERKPSPYRGSRKSTMHYTVGEPAKTTIEVDTNKNIYQIGEQVRLTPTEIYCGNGICEEGETPENCPEDCLEIPLVTPEGIPCKETYNTDWHIDECSEEHCEGGAVMTGCVLKRKDGETYYMETCQKETLSGQCSMDGSMYCKNGEWIECKENEICVDGVCLEQCKEIYSTDWHIDECSEEHCEGGVMLGCARKIKDGKTYYKESCQKETLSGQCSMDGSMYCKNGEWIECKEGEYCIDGVCLEIRNMLKYSNKEVFLISDKDWKSILPLVPVTTWTGNEENCQRGTGTPDNVCVYPTLIYHEEDTGFDADSIIYFMQQYSPDKVTIIGDTPIELDNLLTTAPELGAGLNLNQIQRISVNDYFSYWQSFKDIVYVEDDYELALLASTYASLIDAPLIIQGTSLDTTNTFSNKNIICVGSVTPTGSSCNEQYTLEQLQQKYVDKTNTDKIILVNPDDLNRRVTESFQPEKSSDDINELYSKTSLGAPILAGAKHELILSTTSTNYQTVDNFIETKITNLGLNPEYLTVIASPNTIEMSKETNRDWASRKWREEVDNHLYGNLDLDPFQELAVGRVFSLTISDISSYLARDLFYSETPKNNEFSIIWPSLPGGIPYMKTEAVAIEQIFRGMGLNSVSFITNQNLPPDASEFKNKFMLTYLDHAYTGGGGYNFNTYSLGLDKVWLNSPLVFMEGCASCAFEVANTKSELFCANLLRRGAIFDYGATVDVSAINWDPAKMIVEELLVSENIGQAVKNIRNKATMWGKHWNSFIVPEILNSEQELYRGEYDEWNILIGDPTFDPNLKKPQLEELTVSFNKNLIEINIPEVNKNIKVNYIAHDNLLWEHELFNYPFGNKIGRIFKEYYEVYNNSKLFTFGWTDYNLLLFSLNIQDGYKIKGINRVEYIDSSVTKNIMYMPIFESERCWYGRKCEPNFDYILYAKDEGSENTYYFLMYFQYGKDPSIVKTQETILQHQFKIYLELGEVLT